MFEDAREHIGTALGAHCSEVIFTPGTAESNALVVVSSAQLARCGDPRRPTALMSVPEHDAVREQSEVLARESSASEFLPFGGPGLVGYGPGLLEAMAYRLALTSLVSVCSELGTIQPVAGLVGALGGEGKNAERPPIHVGTAQMPSLLSLDSVPLGVDLASSEGYKIGAPVEMGVLLMCHVLKSVTDRPGGGHERGICPGTPDVTGVVALAIALEKTLIQCEEVRRHVFHLRAQLLAELPENAHPSVDPADALPSIIHLSLGTWHLEVVFIAMDAIGISISAGSTCHAGVTRSPQILLATGVTEAGMLGVVRVSTGLDTMVGDIDAFLRTLPQAILAGQVPDARGARRAGRRSALVRSVHLEGTPMIDSNMRED